MEVREVILEPTQNAFRVLHVACLDEGVRATVELREIARTMGELSAINSRDIAERLSRPTDVRFSEDLAQSAG